MPPTRTHTRYTGRVQGVGFRATTRDLATSLHLTGWVANLADGSVEMEVQGPQHAVDALHSALAARFGEHRISAHHTPITPLLAEPSFEIRR